jgi:hypothetical protein
VRKPTSSRVRTIVAVIVLAAAVAVQIVTASYGRQADLSRIQGDTYQSNAVHQGPDHRGAAAGQS